MSEEILGRVDVGQEDKDLQRYVPYYLVFTSRRIIVARMVSDVARFVPIVGLAYTALKKRKVREEYGKLSDPESIFKAHKENSAIPYDGIIKIEMKRPSMFGKGKITIWCTKITLPSGREMRIGDVFVQPIVQEYALMEDKNLFDERANLVHSVLPNRLSVV